MKHLLVVSYYFPPMGGVPVRRVLRFLRHLPDYGWRCSVLTADRPYDPFHPLDTAGLAALPTVERVLRAPARSTLERAVVEAYRLAQRLRGPGAGAPPTVGDARTGRARRRLYESVFFPDPKQAWVRGAVARADRLALQDGFDCILASGYPWSCFVAGERLARTHDVPLVLDYRDAWSLNPRRLWSGDLHQALEARIVARSAGVVTATDWIRQQMAERFAGPQLPPVETLLTGYDPGEWPAAAPELDAPEHLVLTYTGTFNDALPPSPYDQSPYFLIEAVARLEPAVRSKLKVRLIGRLGEAYRSLIRERGLSDVFETPGSVPHERALAHQRAADVLLAIVCETQGREGVLTGKILEYAGAGRPVLALAPDGELSAFVRARDLGWVEPPEDLERIGRRLETLVAEWRAGRLERDRPIPPDLSAGSSAGRLAAMLERAVAGEAVAGPVDFGAGIRHPSA